MPLTKEEIRINWISHTPLKPLDECVDGAMDEWAAIQTAERDARIAELKNEIENDNGVRYKP